MGTGCSRRQVLAGTAAGLASLALPRPARALARGARLQHASIGVGGMGWADLRQIAAHAQIEIVALCDVDLERARPAVEMFPQARLYQDWRELFHYTYPGTAITAGETSEVVWSGGYRYPSEELLARIEAEASGFPPQGAMLLGEEGTLLHPHGGQPSLHPAEKLAHHPRPEIAPRNHYHHRVDACPGGPPTEAGFGFSGPFTEAIPLGTVALRLSDRELRWDAASMKVEGVPEADRFLRREYREGWRVEGL